MQVGTAQSQDSLIASVSITKVHFEKQVNTPERSLTVTGDSPVRSCKCLCNKRTAGGAWKKTDFTGFHERARPQK